MKHIIVWLHFILFYFNTVYANFELRENDTCNSHIPGQEGICLEPKNCQAFRTERNKLKICTFKGKIPVVCCTSSINNYSKINQLPTERISALKCDEYSEFKEAPSGRLVRSAKPQDEDGVFHVTFVGGTEAAFNEFPHMSAIGWSRDSNEIDWLCGGSLISEKFVLSAAHCASIGRKKPDIIRVGDQNLLINEPEIFPQNFKIKNIIIHPKYSSSQRYHDIALFELENSAIFTKHVLPACLPQTGNDPVGLVQAMGYGQTSFAGPQSNALLKGFLDIVQGAQCNRSYDGESADLPLGITKDQICAWDPDGNRDTCQGDSGGPLQVTKYTESSKKYYEIIGVTSFGKFCAAGAPGVYVRVFSYLNWIESIVWR